MKKPHEITGDQQVAADLDHQRGGGTVARLWTEGTCVGVLDLDPELPDEARLRIAYAVVERLNGEPLLPPRARPAGGRLLGPGRVAVENENVVAGARDLLRTSAPTGEHG